MFLVKIRDGEKKSKPSAEKEREPGEYSCGGTRVEEELLCSFLSNHKNAEGTAERKKDEQSRNELKHECLKANPRGDT